MIRETLGDIFSPYASFSDRCLGVLIALLLTVAIVLIAVLAFGAINSVGVTATKTAVTVIESKHVIPAHSTTTFIMVGKVMVPNTVLHPESYQILFKIDGKDLKSSVQKTFFDSASVGEKIEVDYGFGRLDDSYQPVNIRFAQDK